MSFRNLTERSYSCHQQVVSIIQSLEYWKEHQASEENKWLMDRAQDFLERVAKNINKQELMSRD